MEENIFNSKNQRKIQYYFEADFTDKFQNKPAMSFTSSHVQVNCTDFRLGIMHSGSLL